LQQATHVATCGAEELLSRTGMCALQPGRYLQAGRVSWFAMQGGMVGRVGRQEGMHCGCTSRQGIWVVSGCLWRSGGLMWHVRVGHQQPPTGRWGRSCCQVCLQGGSVRPGDGGMTHGCSQLCELPTPEQAGAEGYGGVTITCPRHNADRNQQLTLASWAHWQLQPEDAAHGGKGAPGLPRLAVKGSVGTTLGAA
jgi:hypothetical protein